MDTAAINLTKEEVTELINALCEWYQNRPGRTNSREITHVIGGKLVEAYRSFKVDT